MEEPSDATQHERVAPIERRVVSLADFDACDYEAALTDRSKVEPQALHDQFIKLARQAHSSGDGPSERVYRLLSDICSIHLKPADRAEPWGPMATFGNQRTAIPPDFKGEQSDILKSLLGRTKNPGLRARLADIVWTNDRRTAASAAEVAVTAYLECLNGLLTGQFTSYSNVNRAPFEALKNLQRAFAIAHAISKKDSNGRPNVAPTLKKAALHLYADAHDLKQFVVFSSTAELALDYGAIEPSRVAFDCETLASSQSASNYPMPIKSLWKLAARLHRNANDKAAEQRCLLAALKQTLEMRKQVNSSGAEAYWVQQALLELRHVEGQEDLEDKLILELRHLQRASTKEMKTVSTPLDVEELREKAVGTFETLPFAEAMRQFGLIAKSSSVDELRKRARDHLRDFPLQAMMPVVHIDNEGKPVSSSPGAEPDGENSDQWFRIQALQWEKHRRQLAVAGVIEPARLVMHTRFLIEEYHLKPIVMRSPLVPFEQGPLVVRGLARFFQGDFMSAAYLLIPQLEPCLRNILKLNGHDPVRRFDDGTEEDYDLNAIFSRMRRELCAIFGEDLVNEMDLLFVARPGPSLRNALSHGQMGANACFHPDTIYGCWLMYRLCILFLGDVWKHLVPELDAIWSEPVNSTV